MRVANREFRKICAAIARGRVLRSLSVATMGAIALMFSVTGEKLTQPRVWKVVNVAMGSIRHFPLGDGRTAHLNTDSELHVSLTPVETDLVLARGEVLIEGNGDRPINVTAGSATVRTGNAAFSIRTRGLLVAEVLVEDGTIGVGRTGDRLGGWVESALPFLERSMRLSAGESVSAGEGGLSGKKTFSAEVLAHKLAWKDGWLWFSDETLPEALERFNSYNEKQLLLADPALSHIAIGGRFRPTEPDSFVASLKIIFGVRAATRSERSGNVYLFGACKRSLRRCDTPMVQ